MRARHDLVICAERFNPECAVVESTKRRGKAVWIEGDKTVNGQWKVVIYGERRGWARLDDLVTEAEFNHEDVLFYSLPIRWTDKSHNRASDVAIGQSIVVEKTTKLRFGSWENPLSDQALLFLDWGPDSIALEVPDSRSVVASGLSESVGRDQFCLQSGTCAELSFHCEKDACEKVSFAATRLQMPYDAALVTVPALVRKSWPDAPDKVPLYRLSRLASESENYGASDNQSGAWFAAVWLRRILMAPDPLSSMLAHWEPSVGLAYSRIGAIEGDDIRSVDNSSLLCGTKAESHLKSTLQTMTAHLRSWPAEDQMKSRGLSCHFLTHNDEERSWNDEEQSWNVEEDFVVREIDTKRLQCTVGYGRDLNFETFYFDRSNTGELTLRGHGAIPMANDHDDDALSLFERTDQAQTRLLSKTCQAVKTSSGKKKSAQ